MSGVSIATGVSALDVLNPSTAAAVVGAASISLTAAQAVARVSELNGRTAYISDVGIGGSFWLSDGSRWRAIGGSYVLKNSVSNITNSGAAKVVMDYVALPIGLFKDGDVLQIDFEKSRTGGTSDTDATDIMIGAAATTPGTSLGLGTSALATTSVELASRYRVRRDSSTSIRQLSISGSVGTGASTTLFASAVVPNMDSQQTYLQITSDLTNAAGEVVHLRGWTVTHIMGS